MEPLAEQRTVLPGHLTEHTGSHKRILSVITPGKGYSGIRINEDLLVNLTYTLYVTYVTDIIGVLGAKVSRMIGFYLPFAFLLLLFRSRATTVLATVKFTNNV